MAHQLALHSIIEAVTRHGGRRSPVQMDLATAIDTVQQVARRYGVALADHDRIMARVAGNVEGITSKVEACASTGTLAEFNALYRQRRLEAQAAGRRFPTYASALAKLNRATMAAAATGGSATPLSLFARVFGEY